MKLTRRSNSEILIWEMIHANDEWEGIIDKVIKVGIYYTLNFNANQHAVRSTLKLVLIISRQISSNRLYLQSNDNAKTCTNNFKQSHRMIRHLPSISDNFKQIIL